MAQKRSIDYSAFNIRVHPHPRKQIYVDLFKDAFEEGRRIPLGNNISVKLSNLKELVEGKPLEGLQGELLRYNDIESDNWVNIERGQSADPDEIEEISIPSDLKPNGKNFNFIFLPKEHILISEINDKHGSLSPKKQEKFFNHLFSSPEIIDKFKEINVTILPDTTQLNKIINSKTLKKLDLIIYRPNPNDFEVFEQDILAEMDDQNVKVFEKKLLAQNSQYIKPNEKTKKQIKVAAHNGKVIYTDVDANTGLTNRDKSTSETPFILRDRYDPNETTPKEFIKLKAIEIAKLFKGKN